MEGKKCYSSLIIHTGANHLAKHKLQILKNDFQHHLSTIEKLKTKVFVSGPVLDEEERMTADCSSLKMAF